MIWLPFKRATVLIPAENTSKKHLYVLLTNSRLGADNTKCNLCVNISTVRRNSDRTCILHKGEHEFIKHESFVRYKSSVLLATDRLQSLVKQGVFIAKAPVDVDVFEKICKGLEQSPLTPKAILSFWYASDCAKDRRKKSD